MPNTGKYESITIFQAGNTHKIAVYLINLPTKPNTMELQLQLKMNPNLYVKDPEATDLGKKIIKQGILMIRDLGMEEFTFKKLAQQIGTTEAGIYRYFENKHRLLTYILTWFWTWQEYQVVFHTNNLKDTGQKINVVILILTFQLEDKFIADHIDKHALHQIAISESDKSFLTKHVLADNEAKLFKPYKDLCHRVAMIFLEYNPDYHFSHSLASTLIETAHHQTYFKEHLPSLTDFGPGEHYKNLTRFITDLIFGVLNARK
jgi:AcrR family transcriptional regulator